MINAGRMMYRARFERRTYSADEYGNVLGAWAPFLHVWSSFRPRFGRETVDAGQLESTTAGTLTVRRSRAASGITSSDRVVITTGEWDGKIFNIRSIIPTHDGLEMVVEEGVAT